VFNVGEPNFLLSSLFKALEIQNYGIVPDLMKQWNKIHVNGQLVVDKGLINRRRKEALLFTGGDWRIA
jgi:GH24 family phage-related lysozyme (muramidase)